MSKLKYRPRMQDVDLTKAQADFERYLDQNGFEIAGVRYYVGFNEYLIRKDGIELEYRIVNDKIKFKDIKPCFEEYWELKKKYIELMQEEKI